MAEKEIRLLIVGTGWPLETFLERLIDGLWKSGIRTTLVSRKKPDFVWLQERQVEWIQTRKLRKQSIGQKWDVLYFPWNSSAIDHLEFFDSEIPVVLSCRGSQINIAPYNPERSSIRDGLKDTFEKSAAVHCVSKAILKEAMQYGLDPKKGHVIYPSVDPDYFYPVAHEKKGSLRIISTGTLIWRKGIEYALLTIRQLIDKKMPIVFDIIGDGPEREKVIYTIEDLDLKKYVNFYGQLKPEAVRSRLRESDLFLLSSFSEGVSNAVLEAMACGLPVVTTDCGGMSEAITNGVEGFVVPIRNPAAMSRAFESLIQDENLRKKMGQAARERVLKQFTFKNQIKEFSALFSKVCHK